MKPSRATPSRGLRASTLLAGTSVAALLLGGAPALAGGLSFNGQTQASVTNPANTTVTSIVINNSTVAGAVTNAGTISPGKAGVGFDGATAALALSPAGLAASAQDLTQSERLGLDAPRVLTQAVQDRLVANGGRSAKGRPAARLRRVP